MKIYHGTTLEKWEEIKKEGVVWGKRGLWCGREMDRCTAFAFNKSDATHLPNGVILELNYPVSGKYEW